MKKHHFAIIISLAVSCTVSEIAEVREADPVILEASIEDTRTSLGNPDGSYYPVYWTAGDIVNVNGQDSHPLKAGDIRGDGSHAMFTLDNEMDYLYEAVYPASCVTSYESGKATLNLPKEQKYVKDGFDPASGVMVAKSLMKVNFKQAMSYLKIVVMGGPGTLGLTVVSGGGEKLSGTFTTDFKTLYGTNQALDRVSISCDEPVPMGSPIIVAIPAQTYSKGIKLLIQDTDGNLTKVESAKAFEAAPGMIYSTSVQYKPTAPRASIKVNGAFEDWDEAECVGYHLPQGEVLYNAARAIKLTADSKWLYICLEINEPQPFPAHMPIDIFLDPDGSYSTGGKLANFDDGQLPFTDSGLRWYLELSNVHTQNGYAAFTEGGYEYLGLDMESVWSGGLTNQTGKYGRGEIYACGKYGADGIGHLEIRLLRSFFGITGTKARVGVKLMDGNRNWAANGLLPQGTVQNGKRRIIDMAAVSLPAYDPDMVEENEPWFDMVGLITTNILDDRSVIDYVDIAKRSGINCLSALEKGKPGWDQLVRECAEAGIDMTWENHAASALLPRLYFDTHPEYFRMDKKGNRVNDANCCPSCKEALEIIKQNASKIPGTYPATNHRYYLWQDDGGDFCYCPKCKEYSKSDQALMLENAMIEGLRRTDPEAMLAHLAYFNTLPAPTKVRPADGVFLEYAPISRNFYHSLAEEWVTGDDGITHGEHVQYVKDNLTVFPPETSQVLDYWLDCSMFSAWNVNNLKPVPWNVDLFKEDLQVYASLGIKNITTYTVYIGPAYVQKFGFPYFIEEYGRTASTFVLK